MGEGTWLGGAILPGVPEEKAGGRTCSPPLPAPRSLCRLGLGRGTRCGSAGLATFQASCSGFHVRCGKGLQPGPALSVADFLCPWRAGPGLHRFANWSGDSPWEACSKPHFWRNQEISLERQTSHFSTPLLGKGCLRLSSLSSRHMESCANLETL